MAGATKASAGSTSKPGGTTAAGGERAIGESSNRSDSETSDAMPLRTPLTSVSLADLSERLTGMGQPAFRADQVARWLYQRTVTEFSQMTDVPASLRAELQDSYALHGLTLERSQVSIDGATSKLLFAAVDGAKIEAVLLPRRRGSAVCVSSQAGCAMGCPFCATGLLGLRRNLSTGEIVDQYLLARSAARAAGSDVESLIFMGMGEPLANLENLEGAVARLVSPDYCGIGARRITISTIGIRNRIRRLAAWPWQVGLAISLHAPNDELRNRLVPPSRSFPIGELMRESIAYQDKTRRRVSYEYVMLSGVNDSTGIATELGRLLSGQLCHVNLIPYNPVSGTGFQGSSVSAIEEFRRIVESTGLTVTIRRPRGRDIAAACGQLAAGESVEQR